MLQQASLVAQMVKNRPAMWETSVQSLGGEDPLRGGHGNPFQYSCLENPHGQRSPVGYSPWGQKEPDTIDRLSTTWHVTACIRISFLFMTDSALYVMYHTY